MKEKRLAAIVTEEEHRQYKAACALLGTTIAAEIRDTMAETIARAKAGKGARE